MNEKLKERLNGILPRIEAKEFLDGSGLGNEIGFHIFDYPPEEELEVRKHIDVIIEQLSKRRPDLKVIHINLFELIIDYLKSRKLLDRVLKHQKDKGDAAALKALEGPLREDKIAKAFIEVAKPSENDIVFISGVGNAWPILRSHTLLNNLQSVMETTPLVMFYPGVYDGQGLNLFGRLGDNNYYRAFRLVL